MPQSLSVVDRRTQIRRALRLSVAEGAVWSLMVGFAESYFLADAVRLGASTLQLGLMVAVPLAVGGFGPIIALFMLTKRRTRKPVAVAAIAIQALVLATLSALEFARSNSPSALMSLMCVYYVSGQAAGTAWSSWFGDLVPKRSRGRYFATRNRAVYASACVGLVLGGSLLQFLEPENARDAAHAALGYGFAITFGIAALLRIVSGVTLLFTYEPAFGGIAPRAKLRSFFTTPTGLRARNMLWVIAAFHFSVYLSSTYFTPFMLGELGFTYLQLMVASVAVVLTKAASTMVWGPLVDRRGPRSVLLASTIMVALVPIPWLFAQGMGLVIFAQMFSGASWSAFELGLFTLVLDLGHRRIRPLFFAAHSLFVGWAQLLGGLTGALLLQYALADDFRTLFAVSAGARLLVAVIARLGPFVESPRETRPGRWRALRLVGMRPGGGLSRRPVSDGSDAET